MKPILCLAIFAPLLLGCYPALHHDCQTTQGTFLDYANHPEACDELNALEQKVIEEGAALGLYTKALVDFTFAVKTDGLSDAGGFSSPYGYPVRGLTYCDAGFSTISRRPDEPWTTTAFAHESFHAMQGCIWDRGVYDACMAAGGNDSACNNDAFHPHWNDAIYPALIRINPAPGAH